MIGISTTVRITQKGDLHGRLQQILREVEQPSTVKVGFPAGKAPGDLISIAFWNHEGTSRAKGDVFFRNGKFGVSGPIPARPFITVAMFKGRGEIRATLSSLAKGLMNGTMTMDRAMPLLGFTGQEMIQAQIGSGMGPANSPMTIALKGSSSTLIDSGRMQGAVTWARNQ